MDKANEYLLLTYFVPLIAIIWALVDVKSLLVLAQLVSLGFLVYGAVEVAAIVVDAGVRLSKGGQRRLFWTGYLAYYLPAAGALLITVCLQQVMAKAQQGPKP